MTTTDEWLAAFAARIGAEPPSADEQETLLTLAGVAAHASERTAAPLSCWMIARAGIAPEAATAIARELADQLAGS
jgi:hypothetical protein